MISLSEKALQAIGLEKVHDGETVWGMLHRLIIYHVEGFTIDEPLIGPFAEKIDGSGISIAVARSVNDACRCLVGDTLTDDEEEWRRLHETIGPYLVIHIGPTKEYRSTSSHERHDQDAIWTYDGFQEARLDLDQLQSATVPRVISSLTATFTSPATTFAPVDQATFGVDPTGKRIHDIRFSMSARGIVSKPLTGVVVAEEIKASLRRAAQLNDKASSFYEFALREGDPAKKYLLFFISLEILTHAEFRKSYQQVVKDNQAAVLDDQAYGKLPVRFEWLQKYWWKTATPEDATRFRTLLQKRNDVAHGSAVSVAGADLSAVRELATKIIAEQIGANNLASSSPPSGAAFEPACLEGVQDSQR